MKTNKTLLFPGSFDPFTLGHKSVVVRALALADEVVVAIGDNPGKARMRPLAESLEAIRRAFRDEPRVRVASYEGLTAAFAREIGAAAILRGVRSVQDFEYERTMADINRRLTGVETVVLFTEPQYASVSSSVVRELAGFGEDISPFIP